MKHWDKGTKGQWEKGQRDKKTKRKWDQGTLG